MTDVSVAAADFATSNFRVGSVLSRSAGVLRRHFLTFFIVTVIAYTPTVVIGAMQGPTPVEPSQALRQAGWMLGAMVVLIMLSTLGYAILLHAAFQDMRSRPVRLVDSLNVALGRFFPLIGVSLLAGFLIGLGLMLLIVPGLILYTMWILAVPACVVERRGPWKSLSRSRELTKGYRWKLFAIALLLLVVNFGSSIASGLDALAGPIVGFGGQLIWMGIWGAFSAIVITVSYYDLRVIKDRVDIDEIAAVFD